MTDTELVSAIRAIIRSRRKGRDQQATDLAKYDQIVGLVARSAPGKPNGLDLRTSEDLPPLPRALAAVAPLLRTEDGE
jgi:hypothetical protein